MFVDKVPWERTKQQQHKRASAALGRYHAWDVTANRTSAWGRMEGWLTGFTVRTTTKVSLGLAITSNPKKQITHCVLPLKSNYDTRCCRASLFVCLSHSWIQQKCDVSWKGYPFEPWDDWKLSWQQPKIDHAIDILLLLAIFRSGVRSYLTLFSMINRHWNVRFFRRFSLNLTIDSRTEMDLQKNLQSQRPASTKKRKGLCCLGCT